MDIKILIGLTSVVMTIVGNWYYIRDIFAGKTRPHSFSWLVWGTLTATAFAGQVSGHAGPGAWATLAAAVISFAIFFLSLKRGEKEITRSDWLSLGGAIFALILLVFAHSPLSAVILVTIIDFLGFLPTIRKSFHKPQQETLIHHFLAGLKYILAIIALDQYTLVTWLYPASLVVTDLLLSLMLVVRRRQLGVKPQAGR